MKSQPWLVLLTVVGTSLAFHAPLHASIEPSASTLPKLVNVTWKKGPSLPQGFQDSDGGIVGGTLVTVGGFCSGKQVGSVPETQLVPGKEKMYPRCFLKKTWRLNLANQAEGWRPLPDFPGDARQELFSIVVNDRLYCWGGFSYSAPYSYNDGYALSLHDGQWTWTTLPSLPWKVASAGICALGSRIFVLGGAHYDFKQLYTESTGDGQNQRVGARLLVLDTTHLAAGWKELPACPGTPRMVHAMAAVGGQLYVIGGASGNDNASKQYCTVVDNWSFDPATEKWSRLPDTPIATGNFPSGEIVFKDRYILLVGGAQYGHVLNPDGTTRPPYGKVTRHYPNNPYDSDVLVFDTRTKTFGTADPLPLCNNLPMTVLRGDQLHLIGGETGGLVIEGERFGHHPELYLVGQLSVRE